MFDGIDPLSPSFKEALAAGVTCSAIAPGSGNVIGGVVCAVKSAGQGTVESMCVNRHVALKAAMGGNPKGEMCIRDRYKGMQREDCCIDPDMAIMRRFMDAQSHPQIIRLMTLAPELPGAKELIQFCHAQDVYKRQHPGVLYRSAC